MSRRSPRYRIDLAATAAPLLGGDVAVCRTRDISATGVCLDTAAWFSLGTRLSLALTDPATGSALEVIGDVVREAAAPRWVLGILLIAPPPEWAALVTAAARIARGSGPLPAARPPSRRLRILVVGDDHRQRGAMALYVTSGWDVLFASDLDSIAEAVGHIELDAVIAELDARDERVEALMAAARDYQPTARRIVRGDGQGTSPLIHRYVAGDAGLPALLDAITAT